MPCPNTPSLGDCRSIDTGANGDSLRPPIGNPGEHPFQPGAVSYAQPGQLQSLEALLVRLQGRGWVAFEVLSDGAWEQCSGISATVNACSRQSRPVVRFLRAGVDTSAIRFDWVGPTGVQVNDHTTSYSFGQAITAALVDAGLAS